MKAKMPTSTVENYLKQILLIGHEKGEPVVGMGELTSALGVVPGTTTTMVKSLDRDDLVKYESRVGVELTAKGRDVAVRVLRRHRLIEYFLVETLGMEFWEIHEEAEQLEHAISDRVLERIDAFLGHPTTDPHGDQIPTANGELRERDLKPLSGCEAGTSATVAQIKDQDTEFLKFIHGAGLRPGAEVEVEERSPLADAITVRLEGGRTVALGTGAAAKILVE